jgi:hypothetical protein
MSATGQPPCNALPAVEGGPALGRVIPWVVGAIGIASGVISAISYSEKVVTFLKDVAVAGGVTAGTTLAAVAGAALGFAIGLAIVISKASDRLKARPGINRCYGGVVNGIALAYRSAADWAFPYGAQHDRVDVVVKRAYWPLIIAAPAAWAWCATDMRTSALIRSYFFSQQVKSGAEGAIAGAVIGGIGAAVVGYFAGVGVAAAIGSAACAASLWFYLLCLLVVVVVALVVALVLTLISATVGGAIGAGAAGGGSGAPSAPGGGSASSTPIAVGQYITLNGNLTVYGEDNDAWVAWWVDVTTSPPVLHGVSMAGEGPGGGAPFSFVDADGGFTDACPAGP